MNAIDLPQADWHKLSADDIFRRLASSLAGLSESEAATRLRHEGANLLTESASLSWIKRFGKHLRARFALLLWAGAALAFIAERFDPGKGMALISGALVAVVLLNAVNEQQAQIEKQHAENNSLRSQLEAQRKQLLTLQAQINELAEAFRKRVYLEANTRPHK